MLCALTAAAAWLIFATYVELPVSTTHSIGEACGVETTRSGPHGRHARSPGVFIVVRACLEHGAVDWNVWQQLLETPSPAVQ